MKDREEGVILADALLQEAHLQPVGIRSKLSFQSSRKTSSGMGFCDEDKALYRFVSFSLTSACSIVLVNDTRGQSV